MNNIEFANIARNIATNYKTLYVLGCFGAPLNSSNKKRYTNNYDYNKRSVRKEKIMKASSDTFGFDCVCLIKGILWGWDGNKNHIYGGADYNISKIKGKCPDYNADQMIKECTNISRNFSNIEIGELVHIPGHIGIYVGDGLIVECTPIWKDGVQLTSLLNIGSKSGYNGRVWNEHGKLKYINYVTEIKKDKKSVEEVAYEVIEGIWGNGEERKERLQKAGYDYNEVQKIVNELLNKNSNSSNLYYPQTKYKGSSIVDALKELGVDSSFKNRKRIANKNGISLYLGTPSQNNKLLQLLKNGKLRK